MPWVVFLVILLSLLPSANAEQSIEDRFRVSERFNNTFGIMSYLIAILSISCACCACCIFCCVERSILAITSKIWEDWKKTFSKCCSFCLNVYVFLIFQWIFVVFFMGTYGRRCVKNVCQEKLFSVQSRMIEVASPYYSKLARPELFPVCFSVFFCESLMRCVNILE